uniref:Dynein light chain n=1 Tax=Lygus hesperus TaxID=30085 RepID=A0A0A9W1R7_LYGHE
MEISLNAEAPPELPPYDTKFYQERTPVVKFTDMTDRMKKEVIALTHKALAKFLEESEVAAYIKAGLDRKYAAGSWQVIIGRNVGLSCCYEIGKFIYFYIGQHGFIIYRTGAI